MKRASEGRFVRCGVLTLASLLVLGPAARAADPIVLCAHVSITGPAPIPHHPARFGQFYFDSVNAELGGVDGRPVTMHAYDDQGYPAGARAAVERCKEDGPVLYVGESEIDQVVSVANWAEQREVPYVHFTAARSDVGPLAWSAFLSPPAEDAQRALANMIADNAQALGGSGTPAIGMISIASPYYVAGHDAFVERLRERGLTPAVDRTVQKDETQFSDVYLELRTKGVRVINVDATFNIFSRMVRQEPVGYSPTYVSASPVVGSNIAAQAAGARPLFVLHDPGPVYPGEPYDHSSLPWSSEIDEFERIFREYSPEQTPRPDDFDWSAYLVARQMHRLLLSLGGDYSAEHIRAAFATHSETPTAAFPTCALDFASEPRIGQHAWHAFENVGRTWAQRAFCATQAVDFSAPTIECGDVPVQVVTRELDCTLRDDVSGVGIWTVESLSGAMRGDGKCARIVQIEIPREIGADILTIRAHDCAGYESMRSLVVASLPG